MSGGTSIPRPLETHVFTSLHYGTALGVVSEHGSWIVSGAEITKIEE